MKKSYTHLLYSCTIIFMLFCASGIRAQFNDDAPWRQELNTNARKNGKLTINEMTTSFDKYWLTHDKDKKGSGYKPFKRWEYHWRNNTHPDGTFITPAEINVAWESKKNQKNQKSASSNALLARTSSWQPVGPFNFTLNGTWSGGQGRVNTIYVDPNNASIIYVGTPAGGIWKSINGGTTWAPLSDELPQIGVSGIVTDKANSNTIYIATGDKDLGDTYSIGVLKSTNGGTTWNTTGLTFTNTWTRAGDIYMHPTNSNILWVATSEGVYKTTDAGVSWTNILYGDIKDIKLKPNDPNTIYAVTSNAFYKSTNGGTSFSQVTSGLPADSGRLIIGVTAANANYVYVLSAKTWDNSYDFQGLYRSTNSGSSFTKTASTENICENNQAWYDFALEVSPTNANLVFTGVLNIWKSTNGGTSFTKVNEWSEPTSSTYTHADIHFLRYYGTKLYCGSDGGIYESSNDGVTFTSKTNGLQIGQFYKIAVAKQTSANMMGGLQDNGGYGFSGNQWKNFYGADGMDTGIDPNNSNKFYGFIQHGWGLYVSTDGGTSLSSSISMPAEESSGNWVTPLTINSTGEVFAGYSKVYRLNGTSWVGSNTSFNSLLDNVTVAPSNNNIMYVSAGTELYKSTDKGVNFTLVHTFPFILKGLCVHTTNSSIVYAVVMGTDGLVYKSTNGGTSFTSINTGLPAIGKNVIVHQNDTNNTLYVGTTLGVYYKDDTMSSWLPFETGLPNVSVTDLEINYVDNNLTAATYGRGVWRTSIGASVSTNVIPGTIQAENYASMSGVQTQTTGDVDGNLNVGWIGTGDYMNYTVNVATAGQYTVNFRVASPSTTGGIQLKKGTTVLGSIAVPNTGAWQTYTTVSTTVTLTAGVQTLQIYASGSSFNINWFSFISGFSPDPTKKYYIDCPALSKRLAATGSSEDAYTTTTTTTGANVEWSFVSNGNGYWFIRRAAGGTLPGIRTDNTANADMHSVSSTGSYTYWGFNTGASPNTYFATLPDGPTDYRRLQINSSGEVKMVSSSYVGTWESFTFTQVPTTTIVSAVLPGLNEKPSVASQVIRVFPNPTYGKSLNISGIAEQSNIMVFNVHGQLIKNSTVTAYEDYSIETSDISKGIYILKVNGLESNTTKVFKVSIN